MALGTALVWGAVAVLLLMVDPTTAQHGVLAIFYAALFIALTGTFSIIGLGLRRAVSHRDPFVSRQVTAALRQGLFLAVLAIYLLTISHRGELDPPHIVVGVVIVSVAEFFLMSRGRVKKA